MIVSSSTVQGPPLRYSTRYLLALPTALQLSATLFFPAVAALRLTGVGGGGTHAEVVATTRAVGALHAASYTVPLPYALIQNRCVLPQASPFTV